MYCKIDAVQVFDLESMDINLATDLDQDSYVTL